MFRPTILALLVVVAVAACNRDSELKTPKLAEVMPNVPLPPNATFVSKSGGEDAIQITVRSPLPADAVTEYYRHLFKGKGWRLVNDVKDQDGAVVFFVEQNGPPLWVRIRSDDDGKGTLVDLAGAQVNQKTDSTRVISPPAGPKPTT